MVAGEARSVVLGEGAGVHHPRGPKALDAEGMRSITTTPRGDRRMLAAR